MRLTFEEITRNKNIIKCSNKIKSKLGISLKVARAKPLKEMCNYYIVDNEFGNFLLNNTKENIYYEDELGVMVWEIPISRQNQSLDVA